MSISTPSRSLHLPSLSGGPAVPRSQAERLWLIGGTIIAAALMLLGYLLFISPQRSSTSAVNAQVSSARTQNSALQSRLSALRAENASSAKYMAELATARAALPSSSGISDFVRSLQAMGNTTGTAVTAVTVGAPTAVVAPVATPTPGATSTAPAPAPVPGAAAAVPTLYSMAITGQVSGSAHGLDAFLQQLQAVQPRAVLVTSITEAAAGAASSTGGAPAGKAGQTTLSLVMQAFVAPNLNAMAAAATATPTPAP